MSLPFMHETDRACPVEFCRRPMQFNSVTKFYVCPADRAHWYSPFATEMERQDYLAEKREAEIIRHQRHRRPAKYCQFCH